VKHSENPIQASSGYAAYKVEMARVSSDEYDRIFFNSLKSHGVDEKRRFVEKDGIVWLTVNI
jgi:hypothetical protein